MHLRFVVYLLHLSIGNTIALKVLEPGKNIRLLGELGSTINEIIAQVTSFFFIMLWQDNPIYPIPGMNCGWTKWSFQKKTCVSKLKSLPPTSNAFLEHLYRVYCQTMVWKSASSRGLSALDPAHFSYRHYDNGLSPVTQHEDVSCVWRSPTDDQM